MPSSAELTWCGAFAGAAWVVAWVLVAGTLVRLTVGKAVGRKATPLVLPLNRLVVVPGWTLLDLAPLLIDCTPACGLCVADCDCELPVVGRGELAIATIVKQTRP